VSNFRFSILATFNVAIAISLAVLAVYGASSLTPISDKKSAAAQGSVAGISAEQTDIIAGAKPLVFTAASDKFQVARQNENVRIFVSLPAGSTSVKHPILSIYNPNFVAVDAYVSVKVPDAIQAALTVDLMEGNGESQLFAPGLVTLPVVKVSVAAQGHYVVNVRETALQPLNFDSSLTYFVNSDF
jgi:hypothetical protein